MSVADYNVYKQAFGQQILIVFRMVFSAAAEDKMLIKNVVLFKRFSSRRLLHEFPQKCWNKNSLDVLLRRRSEAAINFCLGWVQAERHRWLVAAKAEDTRSLWTID